MPSELGNLSLWIGPAIVAAIISAIVAVIGIVISTRTTKSIHQEKLSFDKDIARQKADSDISLALQKHDLDRELKLWERKTVLAEEVLTLFYEAQKIIAAARFPGSFSNEGSSRKQFDWETEQDKSILDAYYVTIERLEKKAELFSNLHSKRFRAMALFGKDALKPFDDLFAIYNEIVVAVRVLLETYRHDKLSGSRPENRNKWEAIIGWGPTEEDQISTRVDSMISSIEAIFRPMMQVTPRSEASFRLKTASEDIPQL